MAQALSLDQENKLLTPPVFTLVAEHCAPPIRKEPDTVPLLLSLFLFENRRAMALASLSYDASSSVEETKGGIFVYDGTASRFHEWEFRTRLRMLSAAEGKDCEGCGVVLDLGDLLDLVVARDVIDPRIVVSIIHGRIIWNFDPCILVTCREISVVNSSRAFMLA